MSAAHLHAVPDPDDVPAPAPAPAAVEASPGEGAAVVELLDAVPAPAGPGETDEDQEAEAADGLEEQDDAEALGEGSEEPGEEDAPRRALEFPDLRPYVTADRETVVDIGRGLAPMLRAAGRALRSGAVVVLLVLRAWFSGEIAPKIPLVWRLILGPLVAVYAVGQTVVLYPWAPLLLVPALPLVAVIARRWADGQAAREAKAKASAKGRKGSAKEVSKEAGKGAPKAFAARLSAALARPSAKASPEAPAEASAEPAETPATEPGQEAAEELEETPVQEAPAAPSRDQIVRALHALVGGSSGVLHTALRDHLRYPSTRAVREALEAANIPSRSGVRAVGGNGPGVHRADIPPLPPSQEGDQESPLSQVTATNNNANNTGEGPREGLAVEGNDQEPRYPFDVVPDPERGPTSWKIVPHD
ncbi:hypothetical protein [Streptomyces sp. NPDC006355]|uniref:hypothetical protein n=1 Tax=Streptomyces sp. NPDC006355 TaxID=3156758 RepID=UPI0033A0379F